MSEESTMASEGFDPKRTLGSIRESVGKFIEDGISAVTGAQHLPLDIYETETSVIVKAGPFWGIEPEALDVSFTGDTLTIKGIITPDDDIPAERYLRRERKFGPFTRSVKIPRAVKAEESVADFKDGLLIITLPKLEEPEPKVINIRSVGGG
jgi:HSP20 family protein